MQNRGISGRTDNVGKQDRRHRSVVLLQPIVDIRLGVEQPVDVAVWMVHTPREFRRIISEASGGLVLLCSSRVSGKFEIGRILHLRSEIRNL